jgi:hypothetical protein
MSTDLAKHGVYLSISFLSLFILTQTTRFPIFEVSSAVSISNPSFVTLLAFLRCLVELSLIIWLLRKLVEAERTNGPRVALGLVLLTAAHGVLASWEIPLLNGNLSLGTATEQALQWMILIGIQYGIVTGLAKMRQAWSRIDLSETESEINQSSDIGTMGSDKTAAFKLQKKTNVRRRPRKKPNRDRR